MSFKVDVKSHLDDVLGNEAAAIYLAMNMIGEQAESYAKESLTQSGAVDTGRLRNSVTNLPEERKVTVGTNVEYSTYIEFGTSKMAPRPYIKPAVFDHLDEYKQMILSQLQG